MRVMIEIGGYPGEVRKIVVLDVIEHVGIGGTQVQLLAQLVNDVAVEGERIMAANIITVLVSQVADLRHRLKVAAPADLLAGEMPHQVIDSDGFGAAIAIADS